VGNGIGTSGTYISGSDNGNFHGFGGLVERWQN
jgi:hypothetical protein